ncbi:MAG: Hpt domain-containing protein [Nitrospira sp.]|nr:Hpt domain-containing protein [Nitrospira sp.]
MRKPREILERELQVRMSAQRHSKKVKKPPTLSVDPSAWQPILEAQRPDRPDVLAKMLGLFIRDSRKLIETLLTALASQNHDAVLESAHGLKSCCAMVGAYRLYELCDQIEELGPHQPQKQISTLIAMVRQEFDQVCDIFSAELTRRTS